jgi:hypothetical protein
MILSFLYNDSSVRESIHRASVMPFMKQAQGMNNSFSE